MNRTNLLEAEREGSGLELLAGLLVDLESVLEGRRAFGDGLERGLESVDEVLRVDRSIAASNLPKRGREPLTTEGVAK